MSQHQAGVPVKRLKQTALTWIHTCSNIIKQLFEFHGRHRTSLYIF